jgi:hypothetical protein
VLFIFDSCMSAAHRSSFSVVVACVSLPFFFHFLPTHLCLRPRSSRGDLGAGIAARRLQCGARQVLARCGPLTTKEASRAALDDAAFAAAIERETREIDAVDAMRAAVSSLQSDDDVYVRTRKKQTILWFFFFLVL